MTASSAATTTKAKRTVETITLEEIVVRFAGDSGDGMQLAGNQMTNTAALFGNDVCTWPDFPAEIRAPAGTLAGVSGFQVNVGSYDLRTPGDRVNALIAMNPAALKTNVGDLEPGGVLVVNEDAFSKGNLSKAGYDHNPLDSGELDSYRLYRVPIDKLNAEACKDTGLTGRSIGRCKNFFALGVAYWLFNRSLDSTLDWIKRKFKSNPAVMDANTRALTAGYYFGETAELFPARFVVEKAKIAPGRYRKLSGNEATAMGLVTAAKLANKQLLYASYPITPASDILHELSKLKHFGTITLQVEDEIAAVTAAIGASFAGSLAVTGTSGPGVALKSEAIGLAVVTELPLVIVNVQRGGPSTGLPTKTEQADLDQAISGRNGECPICVLAPATPADCFTIAIEAFRIATQFMLPVMILSDGYLANGAEPWRVPDLDSLPTFTINHAKANGKFMPYARNADLARPWALPGVPGLEHRVGGLEKKDGTGNVCYEPDNHQHMVLTRRAKVDRIADTLPPLEVHGAESGELLVMGWGSTYGAITSAVDRCRKKGMSVGSVHLRYLDPMPRDLGDVIGRFKNVLIPEMNLGQLCRRIRAKFLVDAQGLNLVEGRPFRISEIEEAISQKLNGK